MFTREDLAEFTQALVASTANGQAFSNEQAAALEEGLITLLNDNQFLHKLVHALMSVQHHH